MAGRILIADRVATNRIVLKVALNAARYDVIQASSAEEALRTARRERPEVLILDASLCLAGDPTLTERLRGEIATQDIPTVLVLTSEDRAQRLAALRSGADEVLVKPLDELVLLARLRSLLRARETRDELVRRQVTALELGFAEAANALNPPAQVALVTARPETGLAWRRDLTPFISARLEVMSPGQALDATVRETGAPDAFVVEADPACPADSLRLLSGIRSRGGAKHAAVVVALSRNDRTTAALALDLGANDLITLDPDPEELALRLTSHLTRKREADRLRATVDEGLRLAAVDSLTGLFNRRYAIPHLQRIAGQAAATGRSFAVLLADLDHFKAVNDQRGHAAGDAVLVEVARRLRESLRGVDLLARIGGEEFLAVMPDTALPEARGAAERLRAAIADRPVTLPDGRGEIRITTSIGIAIGAPDAPGGMPGILALMEHADKALYRAKSEGRDQITIGCSIA